QSPAWCAVDDPQRVGASLDLHHQCLVTAAGQGDAGGKIVGITPEQVEALYLRDDVDAVIVEGDGSRNRPFKAPASHEPVVPPRTTHLVLMVGADAFGKRIDHENVHRPERVWALTGATAEDVV